MGSVALSIYYSNYKGWIYHGTFRADYNLHLNVPYTVLITPSSIKVNNSVATGGAGNYISTSPLVMFGAADAEIMPRSFTKIYKFVISEEGETMRDFIPALTPDGEPCMYEKIAGKALLNVDSGRFIAGVETQKQLRSLLAKLPDKTGQTQGVLKIRLDASLQTDELRAMIDERGEAKNWEITEAA